jgi:hypothetical protein
MVMGEEIVLQIAIQATRPQVVPLLRDLPNFTHTKPSHWRLTVQEIEKLSTRLSGLLVRRQYGSIEISRPYHSSRPWTGYIALGKFKSNALNLSKFVLSNSSDPATK